MCDASERYYIGVDDGEVWSMVSHGHQGNAGFDTCDAATEKLATYDAEYRRHFRVYRVRVEPAGGLDMSDNEHVTAIRGALTWLRESIADTENARELGKTTRLIHKHLDAFAAELAAANARAARLRKAVILLVNRLNAARGYEDQTGVQIESDLSWEDLHLRYGDLDVAPGDTAGER